MDARKATLLAWGVRGSTSGLPTILPRAPPKCHFGNMHDPSTCPRSAQFPVGARPQRFGNDRTSRACGPDGRRRAGVRNATLLVLLRRP